MRRSRGDAATPAATRRARLAQAARDARALQRESAAWARAAAACLQGALGWAQGETAAAAVAFERSEQLFLAVDMPLHAAVTRRRRGELLGGVEGVALVADADRWMRAQAIQAPERVAGMLACSKPD